ncbi:hypothetical protein IQ211_17750 [Xenorhabdus griffiniae]|nr:hypothetical protein [Xenorhabdus griffiniae]MBE8589153.1 hypothetical protein [Xenorhabdus griffiniae]
MNCGTTFVSHETFVRRVAKSNLIEFAQPHPTDGQQTALCFDNF